MADDPKKRESMKEAVEGFERDRWTVTFEPGTQFRQSFDNHGNPCYIVVTPEAERPPFHRQDVLDLLTAANDARQLAIASPKLAEQATRQATRLSDLAERIAMLLEGGE